ncbi:MAG: sigma 54-dependent Fis family transcriptional regulator [Myxococcaceae bacterium]
MAVSSTEPLSPAVLVSAASAGTERRFNVTVRAGPDEGRTMCVEGTVVVGTQSDAALCLTDPTVSRFHLELQARPEGVRVKDLGSRNGTFSLGTRIQEVTVAGTADFSLGRTVLRIEPEADAAVPEGAPTRTSFGDAIGEHPNMRRVFEVLERAARTDFTLLLLGETGTGKELLARGIHKHSSRRDRPFVVVDCGAMAPSLVESELFGHARGAFTGAATDRKGMLLEAHGGTLFLDEIGELPLDLQPKLLRVLESGTVRRVGDEATHHIDIRVVAATHRDLEAEVAAGRFRADLYYRLAVVSVHVPALRERAGDIPLLARRIVQQAERPDFALSPELEQKLIEHTWPGNVRELRNVIQLVLAGGELEQLESRRALSSTHAIRAPDALKELPFKEAKERIVDAFTREYLLALLERCDNNISEVARSAGLARSHVHGLLSRYGIKSGD